MKGEWCPGGGTNMTGVGGSDRPKRRRVRCPRCGRLLMLAQTDCHAWVGMGDECWHESVPPHRVKVRRPRMPSRKVRKGRVR